MDQQWYKCLKWNTIGNEIESFSNETDLQMNECTRYMWMKKNDNISHGYKNEIIACNE